jgi:hypothetical protein
MAPGYRNNSLGATQYKIKYTHHSAQRSTLTQNMKIPGIFPQTQAALTEMTFWSIS